MKHNVFILSVIAEMNKMITSGKATGHEKLLIKGIKESSGSKQRTPYRDNRPFLPSFVSSCK
jgi:hypothetical protein